MASARYPRREPSMRLADAILVRPARPETAMKKPIDPQAPDVHSEPKPAVAPDRPAGDLGPELERFTQSLPAKGRRREFQTASGIALPPVFLPPPGSEGEYREKLGFPGEAPFTRGIYPT